MNILFIIKVNILKLIKLSYWSPPLTSSINPKMVNNYEHVVQSLLNTQHFGVYYEIHT